jgi:rhodanese-related sulfurtransferase
MTTITVEEMKALLDKGEPIHLVDVREPHEHTDFNIGGLLLPLGQVQTLQIEPIEDWKQEPVYFYCRSGNRSGQACMMLESLGLTKLINLTGGMLAWQDIICR